MGTVFKADENSIIIAKNVKIDGYETVAESTNGSKIDLSNSTVKNQLNSKSKAWDDKPLGKIIISVIAIILGSLSVYFLTK